MLSFSKMFIICFCTGLHLELWMCSKELDWVIWETKCKSFNLTFQSLPPPSPLSSLSAAQTKFKVRESFVDVNERSGFWSTYASLEQSLISSSRTQNLTCLIFLDFLLKELVWFFPLSPYMRRNSAHKEEGRNANVSVQNATWRAVSVLCESSRCLASAEPSLALVWYSTPATVLWEWLYCTFRCRKPFRLPLWKHQSGDKYSMLKIL